MAVDSSTLASGKYKTVLCVGLRMTCFYNYLVLLSPWCISFFQQQKKTKAFAALIKAIELGQPEGYVRSFLDRGFSIETLLSELVASSMWQRRQQKLNLAAKLLADNYIDKLLVGARTSFQFITS